MKLVLWAKDVNKSMVELVGGKSANLGEMYNNGIPIPNCFFVTADAYKLFLQENDLMPRINSILSLIDYDNTSSLQFASEKIMDLISNSPMPKVLKTKIIENYNLVDFDANLRDSGAGHILKSISHGPFVAVRSSATAEDLPEASFAGQQATFLNVKGNESLIKAVLNCFASLFTSRAIYYRHRNGFDHDKVFISVVVQKMVDSRKSGVCFTSNPANNNRDEIVIEAGFGLGETIVSGSISPDNYLVDGTTFEIKNKLVNSQEYALIRDMNGGNKKVTLGDQKDIQKLSDEEIVNLAHICKKIELHYGKPQDIEFAFDKKKLYIVQSRAITTLSKKEDKTDINKEVASQITPEIDSEITQESKEEVVSKSSVSNSIEQEPNHDYVELREPVQKSEEDNASKGNELFSGLGASPGSASGKVVLIEQMSDLSKIQKGDILVTKMTTPDMVPAMEKSAAIVTDEGGITCHAAIVSRELGVPSVVGTRIATTQLKEGDLVTVDGSIGKVYSGKQEIAQKVEESNYRTPVKHDSIQGKELLGRSITKVKLILDLPNRAKQHASLPSDGIGLIRSEFIISTKGVHPIHYLKNGVDEYVQTIYDGLKEIASSFHPRPVWFRTSDLRSDEYMGLVDGNLVKKEDNPMLGAHGIRFSLMHPELLKAEFRAIKKLNDEGLNNIGVMLPFVIRAEEFEVSQQIANEAGMNSQIGVMCETPASVWIMDDIIKAGAKFISFGTNDLTQLTLGIDRNNEQIAELFSELHPAILGEIEKVIKTAKEYDVETSICGQAGSNPEMVKKLIKLGIDSVSVNPDAFNLVKSTVLEAEQKLIMEAARKLLDK